MFNCQSFEGRRLLAEVDALSQVILRPDDEQFFTMRAGQASERELAGRKFRCEDRERMGGTDLGVMRSRLVHEVLTSWLCRVLVSANLDRGPEPVESQHEARFWLASCPPGL